MTIQDLARYLEKLENTASRNDITAILADVFEGASPEEARIICYLSLGRLMPKFEGVEFQMATKTMIRVLALAYRIDEKSVLSSFKSAGDLGIVAESLHAKSPHASGKRTASVGHVYEKLLAIAQEEGTGSVERKIAGFADLLSALTPLSARYIVRIPVGALRLGFSDMTVLDALSWMKTGDKSLRKEIEHAYNVSADIGLIAKSFKKKGIDGIQHLSATAGIPIRPQQAERLSTAEEMIAKLGACAVEWKLDGFRAQVHIVGTSKQKSPFLKKEQLALGAGEDGRTVQIFSRSLENTTHMFPEIVGEFQKMGVSSTIIDGEAIGYDPQSGKHLPFQETIQRKRKHGIADIQKKIPLRYFAFDLLLLNGESLLTKPFALRREALEKLFKKRGSSLSSKTVTVAHQNRAETAQKLEVLFNQSVTHGYEGIMAKKLDSAYQAGARSYNWVKFKHMGEGKLADTLDCVVMGFYRGQGKRSGFGIGAFLVGVRATEEQFLTIAKIGTGLSDEQWRTMRQLCEKNAVKKMPDSYDVAKELVPDVWASPAIVVEVAADEITKTPLHSAKLALRFPRLVSFRNDKSPADATTISELQKLFRMQ